MPTYEYKCQACDHEFELFQSITASAVRKCPDCGKLKVKRLIGIGAGVIFKGSGFYQTDYRSSAYQKDAAKDKAPAKSDKKSDKKSDSGKSTSKDKSSKKSD
ncbi:MAG: zinc ribbon domain-containing protein [Phycisphaerales bacterium]|jgi:putative FmdB family regulatory protein|nr:zinc ribbon domain-containing protein [Phycisphaerales bacterium]